MDYSLSMYPSPPLLVNIVPQSLTRASSRKPVVTGTFSILQQLSTNGTPSQKNSIDSTLQYVLCILALVYLYMVTSRHHKHVHGLMLYVHFALFGQISYHLQIT